MKAAIRFFSLLLMLAVFGMTAPVPAHGEEISVFGPQIFSKVKGKPRTETVQFNVPVDIEGTLIIINGDEENAPKKKRVKKGTMVRTKIKTRTKIGTEDIKGLN